MWRGDERLVAGARENGAADCRIVANLLERAPQINPGRVLMAFKPSVY